MLRCKRASQRVDKSTECVVRAAQQSEHPGPHPVAAQDAFNNINIESSFGGDGRQRTAVN